MNAKFRGGIWLALCLVIVILLSHKLSYGFRIETNILALLPETEVDPFTEKAFDKFSRKRLKQLVFMLGHSNKDVSLGYGKKLESFLQESPYIESIQTSQSLDQQQEAAELVFKHRYHLLNQDDIARLKQGDNNYFSESSLQLLFSPLSGSIAKLISNDPFLLSYRFATKNHSNSRVQLAEESAQFFVHMDEKYYTLITAQLAVNSFDQKLTKHFIPTLNAYEEQWRIENPALEILRTGSMFYAAEGMKVAKKEVSTIGLGSLVAVLLLLILAFYSIRPLILSTIALTFGIACGFLSVQTFFSEIHAITLVFGASLIGVAIDYAFHYFSSATHTKQPLAAIFPAISMGLISSIVGYIALLATPFPGLQQMALFCIVGLSGAFLTVVLLFDSIAPSLKHPAILLSYTNKLLKFSAILSKKIPVQLWLLLPIAATIMAFNYSKNSDDIRQLQNYSADLKQQEDAIFSLLKMPAANQFFIVKAGQKEQLLENMQALSKKLDKAIERDYIFNYSAFTQWVPSPSQQADNYQLLADTLFNQKNSPALNTFIEAGVFDQDKLDLIDSEFRQQFDKPLNLSEWLNSSIGQQFKHLWLDQIDNQYAAVIALQGVKNIDGLITQTANIENTYFVNKVENVSTLFKRYRLLVNKTLFIALIVIFLLLSLRYGYKIASLIILAPIVAISTTLIVLIALNLDINLFNTLALFLVLGIGIDYGLFFAEAKTLSRSIIIAISLSALTTLISFGLLSLSNTPAIHLFGLTMFVGISSVYLVSLIIGNRIFLKATLRPSK